MANFPHNDYIEEILLVKYFETVEGLILKFEVIQFKWILEDGDATYSYRVNLYDGNAYLESATGYFLVEVILRAMRIVYKQYRAVGGAHHVD
jgi:hypothetical protein